MENYNPGVFIGIKEYAYKNPPAFPYNIREAIVYAKSKNKRLQDLSKKELEPFKIHNN